MSKDTLLCYWCARPLNRVVSVGTMNAPSERYICIERECSLEQPPQEPIQQTVTISPIAIAEMQEELAREQLDAWERRRRALSRYDF